MATRRQVRFFLSYAHRDGALVDSFRSELEKQCSGAARYQYEVWSDGQILLGARWRASIEQAIRECDFGLLLVSPSFLGSEFIQDQELPHFVGASTARPALPVGLERVDRHHHDLRGLEEHQIFLMDGRRSFGELRSARERRAFAFELFTRIQERLDAGANP